MPFTSVCKAALPPLHPTLIRLAILHDYVDNKWVIGWTHWFMLHTLMDFVQSYRLIFVFFFLLLQIPHIIRNNETVQGFLQHFIIIFPCHAILVCPVSVAIFIHFYNKNSNWKSNSKILMRMHKIGARIFMWSLKNIHAFQRLWIWTLNTNLCILLCCLWILSTGI